MIARTVWPDPRENVVKTLWPRTNLSHYANIAVKMKLPFSATSSIVGFAASSGASSAQLSRLELNTEVIFNDVAFVMREIVELKMSLGQSSLAPS
jgi:hypothetical protein